MNKKKLLPHFKKTCSGRGSRFGFQHPYGNSQLSANPVPEHLTSPSALCRHQEQAWYTDIYKKIHSFA